MRISGEKLRDKEILEGRRRGGGVCLEKELPFLAKLQGDLKEGGDASFCLGEDVSV